MKLKTAQEIRKMQEDIHYKSEKEAAKIISEIESFIKKNKVSHMNYKAIDSSVRTILVKQGFKIENCSYEDRDNSGYHTEYYTVISW